MSITIACYEDWGAATGTPATGTTRTQVTNMNLKTYSDPAQQYYLNDVPRPQGLSGGDQAICSFKRYFSFNLTGTFARAKNVKITIPSGFSSIDGWAVSYKLTNTYVQPPSYTNEFSKVSGLYEGDLIPLVNGVTLWPFLDNTGIGPQVATSRGISNTGSSIWTQYLVLQFMAFPGAWNDVNNYGTDTITCTCDEMEI